MVRMVSIAAAAAFAFAVPGAGPALAAGVVVGGAGRVLPAQLDRDSVTQVQRALNKAGFSAGSVDGIWGPRTQAALQNFQRRHNLQPTGLPESDTLAALGVNDTAGGTGAANTAVTTPGATTATGATGAVPAASEGTAPAVIGTAPAPAASAADVKPGSAGGAAGNAAAGAGIRPVVTGTANPALATRDASAARPAAGANSFSMGEAERRIAARGYSDVRALTKDAHGVWRGQAMKGGQAAQVWLDFRGDVGQE